MLNAALLSIPRLLQRYTPWHIIGLSTTLALLLVGIVLPLRWNGDRDACRCTYWTPLRPMTAQEAAFLLQSDEATITALTDTSATIATASFLLPNPDPTQAPSYFIHSASAPEYFSEYIITKTELEAALGRHLTDRDRRPYTTVSTDTPERSFAQRYLVGYALTELSILAATLAGVLLLLRRMHNPWQFIHPITGAHLLVMVFTLWYAPALLDYDIFYQRIVLEWLTLTILPYTFFGAMLLSLFCLASSGWRALRPLVVRGLGRSRPSRTG